MTDILFCVHTAGMDEMSPVQSMEEAVTTAARLNAEYLDFNKRHPDDGLTPICFSAPAVWPGTPEQHAADLKKAPHWSA